VLNTVANEFFLRLKVLYSLWTCLADSHVAYSSYDAYEHEKSFNKNFAEEDLNVEK
jgi:hypothetical protein